MKLCGQRRLAPGPMGVTETRSNEVTVKPEDLKAFRSEAWTVFGKVGWSLLQDGLIDLSFPCEANKHLLWLC